MKKYTLALLAIFSLLAGFAFAAVKVAEIKDSDFQKLVIKAPKTVVVEFYSPTCPHCQKTAPEYEKAASSLAGKVVCYKINVDKSELYDDYNLTSVPTFLVFKKGKLVGRFEGYTTAAGIKTKVSKYIK